MTQPTTPRQLGFWMCVALVVGNMIGSGVFLLPAALAPFGWNAVFGWVLTISGALCLATVFAHLARGLPRSGGPYAYAKAAFGALPAFTVAWSYWIAIWVGNAAIATAAISYLSVFFPSLATTPGLSALVTCGLVWAFTLVNISGARLAGNVQLVTVILKLMPLIAVIVLAALIVARDGGASLLPFEAQAISISGIAAASALTLWAMLGMESCTIPAGKVQDAKRTIPRATLTGTIFTGVIYLIVCSAVVLLLPPEQTANSSAPLADFVAGQWGGWAQQALALFAIVSALGALNGWILLQGELPFAMARDGVFPHFLGITNEAGTPVRAFVTSSILLTIVLLLNVSKSTVELFEFLILLATTASLVVYLTSSLAALRLHMTGALPASPLILVIALLGAVYSVWTIIGAGLEAVLLGAALLASGIPVHLFLRSRSAPATQPA